MRRLFLLVTVLGIAIVARYRQRLFLRDPLAKVYAGETQDHEARAYLNYSNNVSVEDTTSPQSFRYIVQNWNKTAGTPKTLTCLATMVCLSDSDHASLASIIDAASVTMSRREVRFHVPAAVPYRVTLR